MAVARVAGMLPFEGDGIPDLLGDLPPVLHVLGVPPRRRLAVILPEKEQMEAARYSAIGVGLPFPVTSPPNAEPAPTAPTTTPQSAAADNDLMRNLSLRLSPLMAACFGA